MPRFFQRPRFDKAKLSLPFPISLLPPPPPSPIPRNHPISPSPFKPSILVFFITETHSLFVLSPYDVKHINSACV